MRRTGVLYKDISQDIKKQILNDNYKINTMIPTEEELSVLYDVSKITIRNAVEILVKEGYLVKKSGKGTMVISNRPFNNLSRANSFSTVLESQGHNIQRKVLGVFDITKTDKAKIFESSQLPLTEVRRLYVLDGSPFIYTIHQVATSVDEFLKDSLNDRSLYNVLNEAGVILSRFEDSFDVYQVDENIKKNLALNGDFALRRIRYGYDRYDSLVEVTTSFYNTDVHKYQIDYEV